MPNDIKNSAAKTFFMVSSLWLVVVEKRPEVAARAREDRLIPSFAGLCDCHCAIVIEPVHAEKCRFCAADPGCKLLERRASAAMSNSGLPVRLLHAIPAPLPTSKGESTMSGNTVRLHRVL